MLAALGNQAIPKPPPLCCGTLPPATVTVTQAPPRIAGQSTLSRTTPRFFARKLVWPQQQHRDATYAPALALVFT